MLNKKSLSGTSYLLQKFHAYILIKPLNVYIRTLNRKHLTFSAQISYALTKWLHNEGKCGLHFQNHNPSNNLFALLNLKRKKEALRHITTVALINLHSMAKFSCAVVLN